MGMASRFVLGRGSCGRGSWEVQGGGLGSRRKLWLGASQSRTDHLRPPRSCQSRKGAQAVARGFWREQRLVSGVGVGVGEEGGRYEQEENLTLNTENRA